NSWFEAYQMFRQGFKESVKKFLFYNWGHLLLATGIVLLVYKLTSYIALTNPWLDLLATVVFTLILDVFFISLIHGRNQYFKSVKQLLIQRIFRKK
ncbi:MAG: hypothetical protein IKN23_10035, partial [Lactococcus sp.]|nr:hypothetical protein [Lactococcus sp.]